MSLSLYVLVGSWLLAVLAGCGLTIIVAGWRRTGGYRQRRMVSSSPSAAGFSLLEMLPDAVFLVERTTGRLLAANAMARKLFAPESDNGSEQCCADILADHSPEAAAVIQTALGRVGTHCPQEIRVHCQSGPGGMFAAVVCFSDAAGFGENRALMTVRDQSAEETLRQALAVAQADKKHILDTMQEQVVFFDPALRIIEVNAAAARAAGSTVAALRGKACAGVWPHAQQCVNCAAAQALKDNTVVQERVSWETGRHFLTRAYPVYDGQNAVRGVVEIRIDITEQQQYEQRLQRQQLLLQAVFDSIPFDMFMIGPNGTYAMQNAQSRRLWGDLCGKKPEEVADNPQTLAVWQDNNRRALAGEVIDADIGVPIAGRQCFFHNIIGPLRIEQQISGIIGINIDISERRRMQTALIDTDREFRNLLDNAQDIIFSVDRQRRVQIVNPAVTTILGYDVVDVCGTVFDEYVLSEERPRLCEIFSQLTAGVAQHELRFVLLTRQAQPRRVVLSLWPLYDGDGAVSGARGIARDVTEQEQSMETLQRMVMQMLSMLSATVSIADRYTEEHCERLQELVIQIGERMKLSPRQMDNLKYGALLHDVGKIAIPASILTKPGKLTDEEWRKIKEHPTKGADIVRQLDGFAEVADIIEQHQERVDGKGYPRGLTQEQIKIEAAIISVVDAYDAMTSDRPYRKAMTQEQAIAELRRHRGTQFNADVVDVFLAILAQTPAVEATAADTAIRRSAERNCSA